MGKANDSGDGIGGKYLLVSTIPVYLHEGKVWSDPLWVKDLELHTDYIREIILACPILNSAPPAGSKPVSAQAMERIRLEWMPEFESHLGKLFRFPAFWFRFWKLVRQADILHFTVCAYPIFYGIVVPWLRRRGKVGLFGVIDGSFWRKPGSTGRRKWLADRCEAGAKAACCNAHVVVATQQQYIEELTDPANSNHLTPAVWIDEESFLPTTELEPMVDAKLASLRSDLRVAFFGRLMHDKGPDLLVEAVRKLSRSGVKIHADFFGEGPFRPELEAMAADLAGIVEFKGMVAYGPEFFQRVRSYHAMVLPARSDEHHRLIFDGFAQAVPIIASSSPGLDRVTDRERGLRFERGSADDLARAIVDLMKQPDLYRQLARSSLAAAQSFSHRQMHRERCGILTRAFPSSSQLRSCV
jgi:glycosyltransferase involved in cell wall biosynthesis